MNKKAKALELVEELETEAVETPEAAPVDISPIRHIDLPPALMVSPDVLKRGDALMTAFGYTGQPVSDIFEYAKICRGAAKHYQDEAERIRLLRIMGIEPQEEGAVVALEVVEMPWHKRLKEDVALGRTVAVRGPAGNGKSTGVKSVLENLGFRIYHLDCTDTTTVEQLVGGMVPEPDGVGGIRMVFRSGVVVDAFNDPNGAVQLDEFDALDPRTALCLQSALHRARANAKRWVSLPDHEERGMTAQGACPIVITMNTYGSGATREYVGRNAMDAASMDRFDSVIDTSYENEAMIIKHAGWVKAPVGKIVNYANEIRKKIDSNQLRVVLSTRRLIAIAESYEKLEMDLKDAFDRDFYERLEPHDRKHLAITIAHKRDSGDVPTELGVKSFSKLAEEDLRRYLSELDSFVGREIREKLMKEIGVM